MLINSHYYFSNMILFGHLGEHILLNKRLKRQTYDTLTRYPVLVSAVTDVPGMLDSGWLGCKG